MLAQVNELLFVDVPLCTNNLEDFMILLPSNTPGHRNAHVTNSVSTDYICPFWILSQINHSR